MTLEKNDFTKSHLAPPNLAQIIIWNLENLEFPSFSWFFIPLGGYLLVEKAAFPKFELSCSRYRKINKHHFFLSKRSLFVCLFV